MSRSRELESAASPTTAQVRGAEQLGSGRPRILLLELAVIATAGATVFLRILPYFHFRQDDLYEFQVANLDGMSWTTLSLNVFGHFSPVNRLGHLVLLRWGHVDLTFGTVMATGLVVVLLLTTLWLCRELRLPPLRRILVVALTGVSIAVVDAAIWLDAALHILPALIATYSVVAAHLRGLNTGARRWHVISVVLFAAGLLTQERSAFALPLILLVDVLLLGSGRPWRARLSLLRSATAPLAAMAVIGAVAAILLKLYYMHGAGSGGPSLALVGRVIAAAFTGVLFPMLVGYEPSAMPSAGAQLLAGLVIVLVAGLLVWRRRTNAGPLLFVALSFLLYYGFLAFSPILLPETAVFTALRLNNAVYVVVPTLVGLCCVSFHRPHAALTADAAGRRAITGARVVPGLFAVAAGALIATVCLIGIPVTKHQWGYARSAHVYEATVADNEAQWTAAGTTILPLRAPTTVASDWALEYGRQESLLRDFVPGWTPGPRYGRLAVLDAEGHVRTVALREEAGAALPQPGLDSAGCVTTDRSRRQITLALDRPASGAPLFASVTYQFGGVGDPPIESIAAAITPTGEIAPSRWPVSLPAGRHTVLVPLQADDVGTVALAHLPEGISLCVSRVTVVRPVFENGLRCWNMDAVGAVVGPADCPERRAIP